MGLTGCYQPTVHRAEGGEGRTMPAKAQLQSPAGGDQPSSQIHQFLDHGFQPPAFGRMSHWSKGSNQARLPDKTKDVVGKPTQGHHQGIGGKLAARQPFEIEIGLELALAGFYQAEQLDGAGCRVGGGCSDDRAISLAGM